MARHPRPRAATAYLLPIVAFGALGASQAQAFERVCERGYVDEIVYSAGATASKVGSDIKPRLLYRTDSTGFTGPSGANADKVLLNGKYYSEIAMTLADEEEDYREKVQTIVSAFYSRSPIRSFSFGTSCGEASGKWEITLCYTENACES